MLSDFAKRQKNKLPIVERPVVQPRGGSKLNPDGRRLSDYFKEQTKTNVAKAMSSATEGNRIQSATSSVSKLLVNRIFKDRNIQVTLYDGKATELVQDYEKYIELENTRDQESNRIRKEIEEKKTNLPLIIKNRRQAAKEEMDKNIYDAKVALEGIKNNMNDRIALRKKEIESEMNALVNEYESDYKEVLNEALTVCKEIQGIISEHKIQPRAVAIPDFKEEPDIDDILELAKQDATLIQQLRDVNLNMDKVSEIIKIRDNHVKETIAIATTAVFTPISLGYALFGVGKKILDIGTNKKLIKQLEEEILICYRIVRDQIEDFKVSYCKPDTSGLETQLKEVDFNISCEFEEALTKADLAYRRSIKERDEKEGNLNKMLAEEQSKLEAEIKTLEREGAATIEGLNESVENYRASWKLQRQDFIDSQVLPDYSKDRVTEISSELTPGEFLKPKRETTIDRLRLYANRDILNELELKDAPVDDSDEEVARYEYDRKVIPERDAIQKRITEIESQGMTRESLAAEVEAFKRELDEYYRPKYRGLVSGVCLMPPNVKAAVDGAEEYFKCDFDNKTLLFLYDEEHDGEEKVLANYIKYLTQQILISYHPNSVKVNIINPTMSRVFSNLQVNMDKVNKNTGEIERGRKYSNIYNSNKEIAECFKEMDQSLDLLMQGELMRQDFDELVQQRRLSGAVTPVYQLNILHRVDLKNEFARYNEEAGALGVLNIYLITKDHFLQLRNDNGKMVEEPAQDLSFLKNVTILGETQKQDGKDVIYLTNLKENKITRFIYNCRSSQEENVLSDMIANRAKNLPSSPVLTEEFISNVTGGKYWQEDAKKFVKLFFGYINGDQSKPIPTVLDENDSVHMFIGGTTGGGKSNVLSVMVNCLKMMYSPSQLDIIYFDFKVVEVAVHANPYKMPHCTAMSGTDQASYLMSLLDFCDKEMMNRYALFKEYNVLKLSELIDAMTAQIEKLRAEGKTKEADELYRKLPRRMVMIVDEAAQAFQLDDSNAVEKVKLTFKRIAQLARAAGIHMILVSQDPSKMPGEVLSLLKVRGCTKATPDVSKAIMNGNDICGRSENQFIGFFATNNDPKGAEAANKRYVVPLNMPEVTKRYSKIASDMAKNDINRNAVIFDDNTDYTIKRHQYFLDHNPGILHGNNILLGEPVIFQQVFRPKEVTLIKGDQQNIGVFSTSNDVKANIFRMITESTYDNSTYWPVYCKSIPDYAPLEFFVEKAKAQGDYEDDFMFYMGKNIVDYDEYDAIYEDKFEQFWKNDVRDKNEERFADSWNYGFMEVFPRFLEKRKREGYTKPMYVFIFDMDKHNAVIQLDLNWKEFSTLMNTANLYDVHIIYVGSEGSNALSRNFLGHSIVGKLGDDSAYGPQFKKIPAAYYKYVNLLDKDQSVLFKPIKYK